jgi:hypothetical protein
MYEESGDDDDLLDGDYDDAEASGSTGHLSFVAASPLRSSVWQLLRSLLTTDLHTSNQRLLEPTTPILAKRWYAWDVGGPGIQCHHDCAGETGVVVAAHVKRRVYSLCAMMKEQLLQSGWFQWMLSMLELIPYSVVRIRMTLGLVDINTTQDNLFDNLFSHSRSNGSSGVGSTGRGGVGSNGRGGVGSNRRGGVGQSSVETNLDQLPGCEVVHRIFEREPPSQAANHEKAHHSAPRAPPSAWSHFISDPIQSIRNVNTKALMLDNANQTVTWYKGLLELPRVQRPPKLASTVRLKFDSRRPARVLMRRLAASFRPGIVVGRHCLFC